MSPIIQGVGTLFANGRPLGMARDFVVRPVESLRPTTTRPATLGAVPKRVPKRRLRIRARFRLTHLWLVTPIRPRTGGKPRRRTRAKRWL